MTTWRPWAILFLPGYWSDLPYRALRLSNPMPAGCPSGLAGMDVHSHGRYSIMGKPKQITMLPSEDSMRQCTVACDSDEIALAYAVDHLKGDCIVGTPTTPTLTASSRGRRFPNSTLNRFRTKPSRTSLWDMAVQPLSQQLALIVLTCLLGSHQESEITMREIADKPQ